MPLEKEFLEPIKAAWTFKVIDEEKGIVAFKDESIGSIEKWKWDFGNGETSTEQNPIHSFKQKGVRNVITLEVEGPKGSSKRTRYWEVMIR
jgi:PKD repeat protein